MNGVDDVNSVSCPKVFTSVTDYTRYGKGPVAEKGFYMNVTVADAPDVYEGVKRSPDVWMQVDEQPPRKLMMSRDAAWRRGMSDVGTDPRNVRVWADGCPSVEQGAQHTHFGRLREK